MTHGSFESSPQEKKRIRSELHRASKAMVNLIVLRDADGPKTPNLDPASHEGWLRQQVFRLQNEAFQADPTGEFDYHTELTLGESMMDRRLVELAQPGRPITADRLVEIDSALLNVVGQLEDEGIGWPADNKVFHDVLPEDFDDLSYGRHIVEKRGQAYNNYPAIISSMPSRPDENETIFDYMQRINLFQYASKPYLARAHAVQPDFMSALQSRMAEIGSPTEWQEGLFRAVTEEHPDPEDQILLRASRLAYQLLINLMRPDDLQIQSRILAVSMQNDITDPIKELWT